MVTQFVNDLPLLFIRIITLSFFSIGFIQYFQRVWSDVFDGPEDSKAGRRYGRHAYLLLLPIFLSMAVEVVVMLQAHSENIIIYHNLALFMLITPLLFKSFNRLEVGLQYFALLFFWWLHHTSNLGNPITLISLLIFMAVIVMLHENGDFFMHHRFLGMGAALINGAAFWLSVPPVSAQMPMTLALMLECMILYVLMLIFVLGYWVRQTEAYQAARRLKQLAYHDQIPNDSYADHQKQLVALFDEAYRNGHTMTFATIDLDHFRQINDRFGRLAGNAALIGVTKKLRETLDNCHVDYQLYLTTGEEFNLVFPNQTAQQVLPAIKECWQTIRKSEFTYRDRSMTVTISVGVTELRATDASINDLYKRVDDSLSKSKRSGRDAITVDDQLVLRSKHTERRLSDYKFFAQGVYEINANGKIRRSNELLLRTYDASQHRWILPDTFEIPSWMQIALLKEFMDRTGVRTFNINLTAAQFGDTDFAEALTQFVESADGPDYLNVEITDLSDSFTTRRISALYRAVGIKIMIDDVGSDNSYEQVRNSLVYVNGIKFALQNLRQQFSTDELKERVKFWWQIAETNHLSFILEGVETDADLALAQSVGIKYVQGYCFSKPSLDVPDETVAVDF